MRILVIQTAFIGDVILMTPLLRALKKGMIDVHVTVITIPACRDILDGNPYADEIILYDKRGHDRGMRGFWRVLGKVRRNSFDLAIVPHRSLRSALLVRLSGIPRRIGFDRSTGAFFFTDTIHYRTDVHEVDRNLDLIRILEIEGRERRPEIFPGQEEEEAVSSLLHEAGFDDGRLLVAIAPGSVWATKRWMPERFAELTDWLTETCDAAVVFIGGAGDIDLCQAILGMMRTSTVILGAGRLSLRASAALLAKCSLLISNDSAPVHLASAVGTPTIALFGPTVSVFGFGPMAPGSVVVEVEGLPCRPCGMHGGKTCPEGHFRCMKDLTVERVMGVVESVLQKEGTPTMGLVKRGFP